MVKFFAEAHMAVVVEVGPSKDALELVLRLGFGSEVSVLTRARQQAG